MEFMTSFFDDSDFDDIARHASRKLEMELEPAITCVAVNRTSTQKQEYVVLSQSRIRMPPDSLNNDFGTLQIRQMSFRSLCAEQLRQKTSVSEKDFSCGAFFLARACINQQSHEDPSSVSSGW